MKVGRIGYINCYPVYGAIDRGVVRLPPPAELVTGTPAELNDLLVAGELDLSVISAVEFARNTDALRLLPGVGITSDGPVKSVMLFSRRPLGQLDGRTVLLSAASRTATALLDLLSRDVWQIRPRFAQARTEAVDLDGLAALPHEAVLVIGDAALLLAARHAYPHRYDLGEEWKRWTGLPFVFAVWAARRSADAVAAARVHESLLASRDWGLTHRDVLAAAAARSCGVPRATCLEYFAGLDYAFTDRHLAGLWTFFRKLAAHGLAPAASLRYLEV
ncbi:MAG TPA: menaquinone biosynthesis protein, partial [Candidatus Binatia bacterium]|nr:menaquinone biosynthesis protein [Candidatus Binatia bacterium]